MKRKAVTAVLTAMCLSFFLGACAEKEGNENIPEETETWSREEITEVTVSSEVATESQEESDPANLDPEEDDLQDKDDITYLEEVLQAADKITLYDYKHIISLTEQETDTLCDLLAKVSFQQIDTLYYIETTYPALYLRIAGEDSYSQQMVINFNQTDQGYCMVTDNGLYAQIPGEVLDLTERIIAREEQAQADPVFTIAAQEPDTEEAYVKCAVDCVDAWLQTCLKENAPQVFHLDSYEMAPWDRNSYLIGGYVDGKKEFLVEVCYRAEFQEGGSFHLSHTISHYTEAGKYWDGVYLKARFRYEDGQVTMLTASGNKLGLYGFQTSGYANFFEYGRREDLQKCIEDSFVYYMGTVVSANQTITMEGKVLNLDIYENSIIEEDEDTIYGNPDFRTYDGTTGEGYYSTGVYFTDMGTATKNIRYPREFSLVFDNYNNDGNPDYAVCYNSDEKGSHYVLESIQSDGRVFNLSGRAYKGGVYVAGCFEPSVRLQRTENVEYIGWDYDEQGELVPMARGSYAMELPALNMYSDRLYLPGDLSWYGTEENRVSCFLWNNGKEAVTTDAFYEIQRQEGEEWITVYEGTMENTQTIAPREYAEMTYDLSVLQERWEGTYRVAQKVGTETAYGMLKVRGEKKEIVSVSDPKKEPVDLSTLVVLKAQLTEVDGKVALQLENLGELELTVANISVYGLQDGVLGLLTVYLEGYDEPLAAGETRVLNTVDYLSMFEPSFLEQAYEELQKIAEEDSEEARALEQELQRTFGFGYDCTFEEFAAAVKKMSELDPEKSMIIQITYDYNNKRISLIQRF